MSARKPLEMEQVSEHLGGNAEVIQTAVKEYFLIQHCKAGLDESLFDITFSPKKSGIQTGFTCNVNNGTQSVRYYIKTHQYGPTKDNIKSIKPPDTKELFDGTHCIRIMIGVSELMTDNATSPTANPLPLLKVSKLISRQQIRTMTSKCID
ncbi:hypothetical protein BATDEDRAFT_25522 [Batrachochytrium dendrobatidis JAM81]|uniref:Uncharacterized protein n=1 Tax=Batrachochytrium dendrobatidis (strain JAM81 / FGSC 10211) TaxID=684364 RepID=F4P428_BATDJ|nr:uncharacterized protein BATDEDRAFT_25522 [Batrachochytrium dendrobatidis JAM81]EGF79756.1 hypothetical protein BATDEDRAFT_25522 [Batrachochytrium dendrobatidis JAM81]|eukprot:XP_006679472.1 hypothetical protein BATDEDRAFT_25522 [Batrachochytrium dendrobatidis JAM81]